MDLQDKAQELEAQQREDAIERARGRRPRGDWRRLSKKWCDGDACGERIPDERRRAIPGVRFCTACQTRLEQEERKFGR